MFENLSPRQRVILEDALDYWADKDRHGELESCYGYSPEDSHVLWEMLAEIRKI